MEGAEALVVATGALERGIARDDLDDARPLADLGDLVVADAGAHPLLPPRGGCARLGGGVVDGFGVRKWLSASRASSSIFE